MQTNSSLLRNRASHTSRLRASSLAVEFGIHWNVLHVIALQMLNKKLLNILWLKTIRAQHRGPWRKKPFFFQFLLSRVSQFAATRCAQLLCVYANGEINSGDGKRGGPLNSKNALNALSIWINGRAENQFKIIASNKSKQRHRRCYEKRNRNETKKIKGAAATAATAYCVECSELEQRHGECKLEIRRKINWNVLLGILWHFLSHWRLPSPFNCTHFSKVMNSETERRKK